MLIVTVELWPKGDKALRRHLGSAVIANTGEGTAELGDYTIRLSK